MQNNWRSFAGKKLITMLLISYFGWTNLSAAEEFSPWDWWRDGCKAYEKGEQSRNYGSYVEALNNFKRAKQYFDDVKKERPDWNQKIIDARIALCEREIAKAEALLKERKKAGGDTFDNMLDNHIKNSAETTNVVEGGNKSSTGVSQSEYKQLREQFSATRLRELKLENENKELKNRLTQAQKNSSAVADLIKEQRIMQEKNAFLAQQLKALEQKLNRPDEEKDALRKELINKSESVEKINKELTQANDAIEKLSREKALINDKLDTALVGEKVFREQIKRIQDESTKIKGDIEQLQEVIRQERGEKNRLNRELAELRGRFKAAEQDLKLAQGNLDKFRNSAADRLKLEGVIVSENDELKKRNERLVTELTDCNLTLATLQKRIDEAEVVIGQMKSALSNIGVERDRLRNENKATLAEADRQREIISKSDQLVKELKLRLERNEKDFSSLMADNEKLRKEAQSAASGNKDKIDLLNGVIDKLQKELEQLKLLNAGIAADYDSGMKRMKEAESSNVELNEKITKLQADNVALKLRVESVSSNENGQIFGSESSLREQIAALNRELEATRKSAATSENSLLKIRELEAQLKLFDRTRKELFEEQKKNQQLTSEVSSIAGLKQENRRLIDDIEKLKQSQSADKLKLLELDNLRQEAEKISQLLPELEQLRKSNRELAASAVTTDLLKKQLLDFRGIEQKYTSMLQKNGELENLIGNLKAEIAELKFSTGGIGTNDKRDIAADDVLQKKLDVMQESLSKQRNVFENERKAFSSQIERLNQQIQQLQLNAKTLVNIDERRQNEFGNMEEKILSFNKQLDDLNLEVRYLKQERDEIAAKYRELQNRKQEEANIYVIERLTEEQLNELLTAGLEAKSKEHYEVAIWHFQKILDRLPNHFEANFNLGTIMNRRERYSDAEMLLQRAVKVMPENIEANMELIKTLSGLKKFGNAYSLLDPLIKDNGKNEKLLTLAAVVAFDGGENSVAESRALELLTVNPNSPAGNLIMAQVLSSKGGDENLQSAGKYYQKAKINGQLPDAQLENLLADYMVDKLETINFMLNGAAEALQKRDYLAAAWYYSELKRIAPNDKNYEYLNIYFSILGGNSENILLSWKVADKDVLSNYLAGLASLYIGDSGEAERYLTLAANGGGMKSIKLPTEMKEFGTELKKKIEQLEPNDKLKKINLNF